MKSVIVKISDIESSGTLCMSPLRYVGECHKCHILQRELRKLHKQYTDHKKIIEELKKLPCNPNFDEEWIDTKLWAMDLRAEAKRIEEELKERD